MAEMCLIAGISLRDIIGMEFERVVCFNTYFVHSRGVSSRIGVKCFHEQDELPGNPQGTSRSDLA